MTRTANQEGYSGVSACGGWGSCGDPGRGCVQICHKGAPRRDRSRRKARNINVSSRALRLDSGLCGRFGQDSAPGCLRNPTRTILPRIRPSASSHHPVPPASDRTAARTRGQPAGVVYTLSAGSGLPGPETEDSGVIEAGGWPSPAPSPDWTSSSIRRAVPGRLRAPSKGCCRAGASRAGQSV